MHHKIQFGAVKGRLTGNGHRFHAHFGRGLDDGLLRFVPSLVRSYVFGTILGIPQRNLSGVFFKTKNVKNLEDK